MLDKLMTLFKNPEAEVDLTEEEEEEAVAALLVEAAHADDVYETDRAVTPSTGCWPARFDLDS